MAIKSREIALKCARSLKGKLSFPGNPSTPIRLNLIDANGVLPKRCSIEFLRQLDNCKDDAARRLILGISK